MRFVLGVYTPYTIIFLYDRDINPYPNDERVYFDETIPVFKGNEFYQYGSWCVNIKSIEDIIDINEKYSKPGEVVFDKVGGIYVLYIYKESLTIVV